VEKEIKQFLAEVSAALKEQSKELLDIWSKGQGKIYPPVTKVLLDILHLYQHKVFVEYRRSTYEGKLVDISFVANNVLKLDVLSETNRRYCLKFIEDDLNFLLIKAVDEDKSKTKAEGNNEAEGETEGESEAGGEIKAEGEDEGEIETKGERKDEGDSEAEAERDWVRLGCDID
jgi:hypothetical protein